MKKIGLISLMLAGFIGGIAFVYSCGGSGSSAMAQEGSPEVQSILLSLNNGSSYSVSWQPHTGSDSFVITDIKIDSGDTAVRVQIGDNVYVKWFADTGGSDDVQTYTFRSGIRFNPGDPVNVNMVPAVGSELAIFLSGYVPN